MKVKNMTIAALALLLAACSNEEILENNESGSTEKVHMTFTAGTPQTRTSLGEDGYAVNWTKGDLVAIYDGTAELCKFEATEVEGSTATLKGEAKVTDTYTAFYPYTDDGTLTFGDGTITFTLPAGQTATAGGFAEGLNPSWAKATDGSTTLAFENLCALVKFTVGEDMAGEGTFTLKGAKSESLAGSLTYAIGGDGEASVGSNASAEVKLSGAFEAGETYYFVVAPATLEDGLSLFYKGSEGPAYRRAGANSVTFGAGKVTDLGTLTLSENFEEAIINTAFIDAVASRVTLTKNSDGTVTLTEANRNAMENLWGSLIITNNQNLKDMSGIEYFTNVSTLYCFGNKNLTSLDVSGMSSLTTLDCNSCALTSLNVSGLTMLTTLECYDNATLTSLDASGLSSLETLRCNNCALTSLNVSGLSKLTRLDCFYNKLASLDVSDLSSLETLQCTGCALTSLNVSGLTTLQTLQCSNNYLTSLDVSALSSLTQLYCSSNFLTSLDVSTLSSLATLFCNVNKLSRLDITSNALLTGLRCGNQTNSEGKLSDMTLILTSAQKAEKWDETWKNDINNTRVNVEEKN